jgi:perosamine synthetase
MEMNMSQERVRMGTQGFKIPVYKPTITALEKEYVMACLDEEWISSKGRFIGRFEGEFANYVGLPHALSLSNGTTALHVALMALGIGPGDEVIVPTLTYVASANAVCYTGAKPVFVDCELGTWNISLGDVERVISSRTRAIMAVHLYGLPCDMRGLMELARKHDLLVVEDCAEAIGSRIAGEHVGGFGDIASFSFYGNKTITTGEGGMVVTGNPTLAERVSHLKGQGLAKFREYWHDIVGYNYRMTNLCAAIGCAQMQRLDSTLERKRQIAALYRRELQGVVEFQQEVQGMDHSHWMVCGLLPNGSMRDPMRNALGDLGIETRPVFYPLHSMPMYSGGYRRMPNSDEVSSRGINFPSYPELSDEQVRWVCESVRQVLKRGV